MSAAHLQRARPPASSGSTPRRRPTRPSALSRAPAAITSHAAGADTANAANAADAQRRRPPPKTRIFVGAMGLIGTEPLVRALPRPLDRLLCLHTFVLLEQEAEEEDDPDAGRRRRLPPPPQLLLLDFIPERPTHPATAAALLTGGGVSGVARARAMATGMRPEAVAPVVVRIGEAVAAAEGDDDANDSTSVEARLRAAGAAVAASPLRLLVNDCRTHTAAVLTAALGRPVSRAEVARLLAEASA